MSLFLESGGYLRPGLEPNFQLEVTELDQLMQVKLI